MATLKDPQVQTCPAFAVHQPVPTLRCEAQATEHMLQTHMPLGGHEPDAETVNRDLGLTHDNMDAAVDRGELDTPREMEDL